MTTRHDKDQERRYETRDAHLPGVTVTAFSLLAIMVIGMALAWGVYEIFSSGSARPGAEAETFTIPDPAALPPGPNLDADPSVALAALREREDAILNSYGWTDSANGIARVPIARAMELYLQRGDRK